MIDLGQPVFHTLGLSLFADHADAKRFYYLPNRPHLRHSQDGQPELALLKFQFNADLHEQLGAGVLSLTVNLHVPEAVRTEARQKMIAQGVASADASLVPVVIDSGTCEMILLDKSSTDTTTDSDAGFNLVERIMGAATPSLYGDNAATFYSVLEAEGVSLIEGAIKQGGLPIGIIYSLQVRALRPAMRAEIIARWSSIYDFFEARVSGGKILAAVDIGPTMEGLDQREFIQIKVDELVPDSEKLQVYQRALDQAQKYILEKLFKPTLGQAPPPENASDDALTTIGTAIKDVVGLFSINHTLRDINRNELKTMTYRLNVATTEVMTLVPQGNLATLLDQEQTNAALLDSITKVFSEPPAEMEFDFASIINLAEEKIDNLEFKVSYGSAEQTFTLTPADNHKVVRFFRNADAGLEITYTYSIHFKPEAGMRISRLDSPEYQTEQRIIRVNPQQRYDTVSIRPALIGLPFDRFPLATVDIRVIDPVNDWEKTQTFELSQEHAEAEMVLRVLPDSKLRIQRKITYVRANGELLLDEWERCEPGLLVIGDPEPNIMDVSILGSARFGTHVSRLIVELRPKNQPDKTVTRILTKENPFAQWSWVVPESGNREYEYRVFVHTMSSEVREADEWTSTTVPRITVGEGFHTLREIELLFLGRSLMDMGLLAVKVRFSYADPDSDIFAEDERLLQDISQPVKWSYPVKNPDKLEYSYQLTFIQTNGEPLAKDAVTTKDKLAVVPLV